MKLKVFGHGAYIGTTGYSNHTRDFFRHLSKYVDIKVRNFTIGKTWEEYNEHPHEIQNEVLFSLLNSAKETEWGIAHNYDKITSNLDFQKAVQLQEYNDIKPFVERLREGEKNLLWPGEVKWFAKSSGTTSDKSKFIPVTTLVVENSNMSRQAVFKDCQHILSPK